tara:strand:+ start:6161 stop:6730 length:570 start_codon:yes stop_codon:yes gene_type:complete
MKDILIQITRELQRVGHLIGQQFQIPPKTAHLLETLRASRVSISNKARDSQQNHLGWHAYGHMHSYDNLAIVHPILIQELAEIHNVPVGLVSALTIRIRDEPALMKGYVTSISPLVLNEMNYPLELPTPNMDEIAFITPMLARAAWAGAQEGWWDAEALLSLPPMFGVSAEDAVEMMANADTEASVTLA